MRRWPAAQNATLTRQSLEIVRGRTSGHVGGFAGPLAKAGSDAGRLGREGKQKLTAAAPAAADGGSAQRLLRCLGWFL